MTQYCISLGMKWFQRFFSEEEDSLNDLVSDNTVYETAMMNGWDRAFGGQKQVINIGGNCK